MKSADRGEELRWQKKTRRTEKPARAEKAERAMAMFDQTSDYETSSMK